MKVTACVLTMPVLTVKNLVLCYVHICYYQSKLKEGFGHFTQFNKWNPNKINSVMIPCQLRVKNWEMLNLDQVPWLPVQLHGFMRSQRQTWTRSIFLRSQCIVWCIPQSHEWCKHWPKWTTSDPCSEWLEPFTAFDVEYGLSILDVANSKHPLLTIAKVQLRLHFSPAEVDKSFLRIEI